MSDALLISWPPVTACSPVLLIICLLSRSFSSIWHPLAHRRANARKALDDTHVPDARRRKTWLKPSFDSA